MGYVVDRTEISEDIKLNKQSGYIAALFKL